ncbi:hypothetical protein DSO57_1023785 [Entomophthora muscae]|uniref:Uncharacterized protein n=1 Tax=Entomophthora muscae TaxID=34485 RepID=A0ACC2U0M3_9FUNG|nr:hypothetical protein DSO57_1023785 [Entomophthora muscae]
MPITPRSKELMKRKLHMVMLEPSAIINKLMSPKRKESMRQRLHMAMSELAQQKPTHQSDVRAIGDNRQAYSPKEQVSGENKAEYGNFKSIGNVKSGGGENKQAYGDVKSIDDINIYVDYTEERNPIEILEEWKFNGETNLEDKNGNQYYSSGMAKDWDASNRQNSHRNAAWDGMNRNNQELSYMSNDNQGWKEGQAWKNMNNNIQAWNSMQNGDQEPNTMNSNEWSSSRQSNGKMFQRHAIVCRQKY